MAESRWSEIFRDLREQRLEQQYRDRAAARVNPLQEERSLERELAEEMARAFSRAVQKLEDAVQRVTALGRALERAGDAAARAPLAAEYEHARRDAIRARWELIVHREAIGLYRHDDVDAHYPIPPRRRA